MRRMRSGSFGMTLIEILVVITVAVVAGGLLVSILVSNNNLFSQQTAKVSEGIGLNNATSEITSDIKSSSGVVASYPSPSPSFTTGVSTLVLQVPSIDSNNNVISQTYDYYTIFQDPQNSQILRKRIFPDPVSKRYSANKVLLNNLSLVKFTYLDSSGNGVSPVSASQINFILNVNVKAGVSNQQSSTSGQINLRNS